MKREKIIEVLDMIMTDVKNDAEKFDGQPFNGRTVAEYLGNHGAAIVMLAAIIKATITDTAEEPPME